MGQEFDVVCYNETPHSTNDASTTQLLSLCSDTELAKDSSDSGVGHVDPRQQHSIKQFTTQTHARTNQYHFSPNCDQELI